MGIKKKPLRYAHSDGHTDVCYSEDGDRLITCGTDGDIRIWSGFDDDDPVQTCVGEWSLCVCQKGSQIQIATDNNNVQLMTFPEAERDGILLRFTAHVNHMAVGKNHNFVAIGAEDMQVKVVDLTDSADSIVSFEGLSGPPLSVALCPEGKTLAVSSGDGFLRVWEVESQTLLKEIECVPKANSFMNAKLLCRIDFEPTAGKRLAYPNNNSVIILNTNDWTSKMVLTTPKVELPYSIVQYSPCGALLAAVSQKGDVVVWNIATQQVIDIVEHPRGSAICALAFNPSGNGEIAFCDVAGQLGLLTNCVGGSVEKPPVIEKEETNEVNFEGFQFDDDSDDENAVSLEKIKNDVMGTNGTDSIVDHESVRSITPRPRTPEIPLQSVFMPSSTPEHLNPRYLCWNDVGIIRSYRNEENEGASSIEVEFHDTSFHNSMMMQNYQDYNMGTLSTTALTVANSGQIAIIPLGSGSKEWNVTLSEDEEIVCVANSSNLVCFGTNCYHLRVYSVYGTQKAVLSVPGPIVSMSACNYFVLVAYHNGAVRVGDQSIGLMLVKFEGVKIESKTLNCALRPELNLQWLGFTDSDSPAVQDSYGMLYLYPLTANVWIPFCDTTKNRNNPADGFFITSVFESLQTVRGIRCRGSLYPGFTPRPTLSELQLEPPFIEMTTEKSQLEANLFTWSTLKVENMEKKFKETALKTFALSCKNNLDLRAFELIEMMSNPQLVTLAIKYASKLNRQRLAEKLTDFATTLSQTDFDSSILDETVSSTPNTSLIKANRKLLLNSASKRVLKHKSVNKDKAILLEVPKAASDSAASQSEETNTDKDETINNDTTLSESMLNTQDSIFTEEEPKNPFLKRLKKSDNVVPNPLSLTDKFAGYEEEKKENKVKENVEKRKQPDSDNPDVQKNKQRKLDKFLFSKRS